MQARFKVEIQDILIYMVLKEKDEDGHFRLSGPVQISNLDIYAIHLHYFHSTRIMIV